MKKMVKKALSLLLVLTMIVSPITPVTQSLTVSVSVLDYKNPSASYKSGKYYTNLTKVNYTFRFEGRNKILCKSMCLQENRNHDISGCV